MKKIIKLRGLSCLTFIFICFSFLFFSINLEVKAETETIDLTPNSPSAILIEVETGKILYEKNAHQQLPPASMTKVMTLKLIFDALESERIKKGDIITASEHAASMGGSQIFLSVGEQMSVDDLLKSVGIASANDAAVALSEAISGSEANFVAMMNAEAKKLGLSKTNYQNVTGLPDPNHLTTCYDMALVGRALILKHGDNILSLTSRYEDYVRQGTDKKFWLVNTNKLVKFVPGVDGLKTGWTNEAGYCLTSTMKKDNMRVLAVVMGCKSVDVRTKDTLSLLNYAFANYEKEVLMPKGTVIDKIDNVLLDPHRINIVLSSDLVRINKKGETSPKLTYKIDLDHDKINRLEQNNIGTAKAYFGNDLIDEVNLSLEVTSNRASFWSVLGEVIMKIFT